MYSSGCIYCESEGIIITEIIFSDVNVVEMEA